MPGYSLHKGDRDPEREYLLCRLSPSGPPATLWDPHSRLLWVARVGEVGLPEASSYIGVGERCEAICVDLHVQ